MEQKRHKHNDDIYCKNRDRKLQRKIDRLNKLHPDLEYYTESKPVTIPPHHRGKHMVEARNVELIIIRRKKR